MIETWLHTFGYIHSRKSIKTGIIVDLISHLHHTGTLVQLITISVNTCSIIKKITVGKNETIGGDYIAQKPECSQEQPPEACQQITEGEGTTKDSDRCFWSVL